MTAPASTASDQTGGRLVLVVGPSGAGKDTLIALARQATERHGVVFVRRIVTRAASAFEDNEAIDEAAFEAALAAGRFALSWQAHGLRYALPASIDADIAAGRTVVANVSRGSVTAARRRYDKVLAVLVTAPPEVLAARLVGRQRASDGPIAARLERASVAFDDAWTPDLVIDNSGRPEDGAARLIEAILGGAADARLRPSSDFVPPA